MGAHPSAAEYRRCSLTTLDLLQQALDSPSAADDHTLQTHFDKIVNCIEREKMDDAADMIEKIFEKGNPDIRLIVYYFFAHFFEHGLKSFAEIFPLLSKIISEHWDVLRPLSRKEKQVENSLTWLFVQLINKLKYVQKIAKAGTEHPIWEEALTMTLEEHEESIAALTSFKDLFYEKWPKSPSKERVMHLVHLAEEFKTMATAKEEKEPEIEEDTEIKEERVEEKIETPPAPVIEEEPEPEETYALPDVEEDLPCEKAPELSCENLPILAEKLKVFEQLIRQQDWTKAAIVAKDINHELENFDPLFYFPKLLSNYFALIAKHVGGLSGPWEDEQFAYLEKLYKTDIKQFNEW